MSSMMLSGILAVACIGCAGLAQYVSRKLSPEEIKLAPEILKDFKSNPTYVRSSAWSTTPKVNAADQWYQLLNVHQERFHALGELLVLMPDQKNSSPKGKLVPTTRWGVAGLYNGHCTAFYIAPTVLVTAAHCLKQAGIAKDKKHILFFRQRYDGGLGEYSPTDADQYERLVLEWTYPAAFEKLDKGTCPGDGKACVAGSLCKDDSECQIPQITGRDYGHDFAFMRTDQPGHGNTHYTLTNVDAYLPKAPSNEGEQPKPTRLILAGYPGDFEEFYRPVAVSCQLGGPDDKIVTEDPGITLKLRGQPKLLEDARNNQVFCIGGKGNMGKGGSGGPWLLDETAIDAKDPEKASKLLYVVGVTSWSSMFGPPKSSIQPSANLYADTLQIVRKKNKATVSPWISKTAVNLALAAANSKSTESLEEALKKVAI